MKMEMIYVFTKIDTSIFNYPGWKACLPLDPSDVDFNLAWIDLFEFPFHRCEVKVSDGRELKEVGIIGIGKCLIIKTPNATIIHGGFEYYTEDPILSEDQTFYYDGGCTWDEDLIGQRFWKIDAKTMKPIEWEKAAAIEVIMRHKAFQDFLYS